MADFKPCKGCGKSMDGWRATCPRCGKTEWDMFIMSFVFGFACLGGVTLVGDLDGPLWAALLLGFLSATLLIMGLVWVRELVNPPDVEEEVADQEEAGAEEREAPQPQRATPSGPTRAEHCLFAFIAEGIPVLGGPVQLPSDEELREFVSREAHGVGLRVSIVQSFKWSGHMVVGIFPDVPDHMLHMVRTLAHGHIEGTGYKPSDAHELKPIFYGPESQVGIFVCRGVKQVEVGKWLGSSPEQAVKLANELHALRDDVNGLLDQHPRDDTTVGSGASRALIQIPWICRTLVEASDAIVTARDPAAKPITLGQVSGGLRKLIEYVRVPDYGTLLEMVYPGIDAPLQACMDELETIVEAMEGAATGEGSEAVREEPADGCQFCGKEMHEGSGVQVESISLSGDTDPMAAMQEAADQMLARRIVCASCQAVFCLECGSVEGQTRGTGDTHCPGCGQAVPAAELM